MPNLRHRKRQLLQVALFCFTINAHHAIRFGKWQTAQKKILYQTKNGGVHANTECQREHRERCESGRLAKLAKSKADVVHLDAELRFHSARKATTGLTREARRAGIHEAKNVAAERSAPTPK